MPKYLHSSTTQGLSSAIIRQRVIKSFSELDTITPADMVERYVLTPGEYIFDTGNTIPFFLDKPFYLDDSAGGTISLTINCVVLPLTVAVFEQVIGTRLFLRINDSIFIGSQSYLVNPFSFVADNVLFNLTWNTVDFRPPVCLLNFVQPIAFLSIGSLNVFDTVLLTNFSIRSCDEGITLANTLNLISMGPCNFQDAHATGLTYINITGTGTSPSIQATLVNYIPVNTDEYCFKIANDMTPNVSIGNCTYDTSVTGDPSLDLFYDPAGLTEESIYVTSNNVKNVNDSNISIQYFWSTDTGTLVDDITGTNQDQWRLFPITIATPVPTITSQQRITVTVEEFFRIDSLEKATLGFDVSTAMLAGTGTEQFEMQWVQVESEIAATIDFATDANEIVVTQTYANDDIVTLIRSDTVPTPVDATQFYYVVNVTGTTIEISASQGGAPVAFTSNGVGVQVNRALFLQNPATLEVKQAILSTSVRAIVDVTTGQEFTALYRSTNATPSNFEFATKTVIISK
jgi:hypothetical protein